MLNDASHDNSPGLEPSEWLLEWGDISITPSSRFQSPQPTSEQSVFQSYSPTYVSFMWASTCCLYGVARECRHNVTQPGVVRLGRFSKCLLSTEVPSVDELISCLTKRQAQPVTVISFWVRRTLNLQCLPHGCLAASPSSITDPAWWESNSSFLLLLLLHKSDRLNKTHMYTSSLLEGA